MHCVAACVLVLLGMIIMKCTSEIVKWASLSNAAGCEIIFIARTPAQNKLDRNWISSHSFHCCTLKTAVTKAAQYQYLKKEQMRNLNMQHHSSVSAEPPLISRCWDKDNVLQQQCAVFLNYFLIAFICIFAFVFVRWHIISLALKN